MSIKYLPLKWILKGYGILKGEGYKYSLPYEDNFKYMTLDEKLWWGYKSVVKQIERAEKGKGIEAFFAKQNLDFKTQHQKNVAGGFKVLNQCTISAGGDLSASEMITVENTKKLWDDVRDFYFNADIVCANLEAPILPSKPPSGVPGMCLSAPRLNIMPEMFERFADSGKGVNFYSTANNHSLDQGAEGIVSTLDFLDLKGYGHVGTSRTPDEQDDIPIIEKNGIKTAFISYTYCTNGVDPKAGEEFMVNDLRLNKPDTDISLIERHVRIAREKGADIIVAMLHWSVEFETYPIENVIRMGHRIMDLGVDIILGGHPHVAQPMEAYTFFDPIQRKEKQGFIIYSLGELVSLNLFSKNSRLASLIKLELTEGLKNGNREVLITNLEVMPIYTLFRQSPNGSEYRVIDLFKTVREIALGNNQYDFGFNEVGELNRLKQLATEKIFPETHDYLLRK